MNNFFHGLLNSHLLSKFLTGGFGLLIIREIFSGVRTSFSARTSEVKIARLLDAEVDLTSTKINEFYAGLVSMIASNNGKATSYLPNLTAPVELTLPQFSSTIFPLFQKYSAEDLTHLTTFYTASESYRMLLQFYRDTFMSPVGISFNGDPHVSFEQRARTLGLDKINDCVSKVKNGTSKIKQGRGVWKVIRSKGVYRLLAVVCGILLIFLPDREVL